MRFLLALLLIAAPLGLGTTAGAATLPADANTTCPVMPEEESDPEIYVDYQGRRVYLCCTSCRKSFRKDPEKYLAMLPPGTGSRTPETTGSAQSEPVPDPAPAPPANSGTTGTVSAAAATATAATAATATASASASPSPPIAVPPIDSAGGPPPAAQTIAVPLTGMHRAAEYAGRLHSVAVHFPIGLLLGAAAVEFVALLRRRPIGAEGPRLALGLGTLGAVVAVPLGWLNAAYNRNPGLEEYVEWHRWLGTGAGAAAVTAWLLARAARSGRPVMEKAYLTALFAGAVLLIVAGHFGAALIYGPDYLVP